MNKKLFVKAIGKYFLGLVLVSLLLFIPAGTLHYWNAWLFIGALFIPMAILGLILMKKDPELLAKRLEVKEKEKGQMNLIFISGIMFVAGFIVAGLDYRFKWLPLPKSMSMAAAVVFLMAYILFVEVIRENAYLSRTVEIQEGHQVVDTGLYGIVRHPMYLATILLFLSIPLILGSLFSFVIFTAHPFVIAKRIKEEEKFLEEGLPGYKEYKDRVKYRLFPYIW